MATDGERELCGERSGHLISIARQIEQTFPDRCLKSGRGCEMIRDITRELAELVNTNLITVSEAQEKAKAFAIDFEHRCIGRVGLDSCVADDCGIMTGMLRDVNVLLTTNNPDQAD